MSDVLCVTAKLDCQCARDVRFVPKADMRSHLLDYLVSGHLQRQRQLHAECFGGLEINNQLNFCDLLHREIGWLFTIENATGIDTRLPPSVTNVRSIAHKTANCCVRGPGVHRWYGMAGRQRDDLIGMGKKETIAAHLKRVRLLLNKVRKSCVDLARATCIEGQECHPMRTRRDLYLSRFALGINGVGRVAEVSDRLGLRHHFEQQPQALCGCFSRQEADAGEISAGSV